MTQATTGWKIAVPDVAGHGALALPANAPMVTFSALDLPDAARAYLAQLDAAELQLERLRARGAKSWYFDVSGFYREPDRSTGARLEMANAMHAILPDGMGKSSLIDNLTGTFASLAAAWDREKITFELRARHSSKDVAHTDYGTEYVAIANLTNRSTLFLPPQAYYGHRPRIYTPEGVDGNLRCEYHMTAAMRDMLEGVPEESLTSWRGSREAAVHLVPEFEGTRMIMLANTMPGTKPALR